MFAANRALVCAFTALSMCLVPHGASARHARASVAPAAREFDFEGATLGMSLADFRAMPLPPMAAGAKTTKLFCSTDDLSNNRSDELETANSDKWRNASGAVVCEYDQREQEDYPWNSADQLGPDGETLAATYYFIPDPRSGIQRLYGIEVATDGNTSSNLLSDLARRFGKATSSGECEDFWHTPLSSICFIERSGGITYAYFTDNKLDDFVHKIPGYYESYGRP